MANIITFTPNTVIKSSEVNGNFNAINNQINPQHNANGTHSNITATSVSATTMTVNNRDVGGYLVPVGGIILWSGAIVNIPSGWALCDGTNGTPNLRDRFIVGAGASYAVGATGGENSVTLSTSQIPAHNHSASTNTTGAHNHGTDSQGNHNHTGTTDQQNNRAEASASSSHSSSFSYMMWTNVFSSNQYRLDHTHTFTTNTTGAHSHTTTVNGDHAHSVTVNNTGGGGSHENRPPYYALAYIMKL